MLGCLKFGVGHAVIADFNAVPVKVRHVKLRVVLQRVLLYGIGIGRHALLLLLGQLLISLLRQPDQLQTLSHVLLGDIRAVGILQICAEGYEILLACLLGCLLFAFVFLLHLLDRLDNCPIILLRQRNVMLVRILAIGQKPGHVFLGQAHVEIKYRNGRVAFGLTRKILLLKGYARLGDAQKLRHQSLCLGRVSGLIEIRLITPIILGNLLGKEIRHHADVDLEMRGLDHNFGACKQSVAARRAKRTHGKHGGQRQRARTQQYRYGKQDADPCPQLFLFCFHTLLL